MIIPSEYSLTSSCKIIYRNSNNIGIWFDYINWKEQYIMAIPKIVFPNYISIRLDPVYPVAEELPYPLNFAICVENIAHKQFKKSAYKKFEMHKEFRIFSKKRQLNKLTQTLCKITSLPTEINYIIAEFI